MLDRGREPRRGEPACRRTASRSSRRTCSGCELPDAGRYAFAFIALNSIMLLASRDAQRRAFRTLAAHLAPGGLAAVDAWLPDAEDLARFDGRVILEWPRTDPETGAVVTKAGSAQHDAATGTVALTRDLRGGPPGRGAPPLGPAATGCGWCPRTSSPAFAEEAGLRVEVLAGGYDLAPIGPGLASGPSWSPQAAWLEPGRRCDPPADARPRRTDRVVSSSRMSNRNDQTRLLIVEDVPQVAQYIRGLLNTQQTVKVLDVLTDGGKALAQIGELRPDVVLVDALLQGRIKGPKLVEQIHEAKLDVPVIVLTVPQNPVEVDPAERHPRRPRDAVLGLRPDEPDRAASARSSTRRPSTESTRDLLGLRAEGRRRQDDHRVQPGGRAWASSASGPCSSTAASSSATCARC